MAVYASAAQRIEMEAVDRDVTPLEVLQRAADELHDAENEFSNAECRLAEKVTNWNKAVERVTAWIDERAPDHDLAQKPAY